VQLKNEAYLVDMAEIMDGFTQYVPSEKISKNINIDGKEYIYDDSKLMQILFFGDQLTVARARGASTLREPQKMCLDCLEGFNLQLQIGMQGCACFKYAFELLFIVCSYFLHF